MDAPTSNYRVEVNLCYDPPRGFLTYLPVYKVGDGHVHQQVIGTIEIYDIVRISQSLVISRK